MKNNTLISGDWIRDLIREFIATSPHNTMKNATEDRAWDDVLVGFSSGADQIWQTVFAAHEDVATSRKRSPSRVPSPVVRQSGGNTAPAPWTSGWPLGETRRWRRHAIDARPRRPNLN